MGKSNCRLTPRNLVTVVLFLAGILAFFADFFAIVTLPYPFPYLIGLAIVGAGLGYFAYTEKHNNILRTGALAALGAVLLILSFLLGGVVLKQPGEALILVSSRFDRNAEGWTIEGGGTGPIYQEIGGNEGGHIVGTENSNDDRDWFWKAPPKFLGDQSDAYGGILVFNLRQDAITDQITPTDDIVLSSGSVSLYFDIDNPGREWTAYAIPLHELAGWRDHHDDVPTESEMRLVLSSLDALMIRGEYHYGVDTGGLDNVVLLRRP
jgi:hypothetical protein